MRTAILKSIIPPSPSQCLQVERYASKYSITLPQCLQVERYAAKYCINHAAKQGRDSIRKAQKDRMVQLGEVGF
jgi:hypothetical protein